VVPFATLLTSHLELSSSATRTSLARICRQRRPFELVVAIATANSTNRFNDGLGAPLG
jgi:alkylhydroperoxidase family enzyme